MSFAHGVLRGVRVLRTAEHVAVVASRRRPHRHTHTHTHTRTHAEQPAPFESSMRASHTYAAPVRSLSPIAHPGGFVWQEATRALTESASARAHSHTQAHTHTHILGDGSPLPASVRIVEVGPRDGLQNEPTFVPTPVKIELINALVKAGISYVEAAACVNARAVPQMADALDVLKGIDRTHLRTRSEHSAHPGTAQDLAVHSPGMHRGGGSPGPAPGAELAAGSVGMHGAGGGMHGLSAHGGGTIFAALTPNMTGFETAVAGGADEVAVFAAASDAFSKMNVRATTRECMNRFIPILEAAKARGIPVRGYVSCVVGCPYQGLVAPEAVAYVALELAEMGCREISLGDTIGVGTPHSIARMLESVKTHVPAHMLALHAHDTYGMGVANALTALAHGVRVIDASVAGLGGCPYARGASGNVATEDIVYMLEGMGIHTGINLDALVDVSGWICGQLKRENKSRVASARLSNKRAMAEFVAAKERDAAIPADKQDPDVAAKRARDEVVRRIALSWPQRPDQVVPPPPQPSANGNASSGSSS